MAQFQAANLKALRRRGLVGDRVTVAVSNGALQLAGDGGGAVTIPANGIARVRIGFVDGKRRIYELHLWETGSERPLNLVPVTGGYSDTVRELVALLSAAGLEDRITLGSSRFDAALAPVLIGLVALAACLIAAFALTNEPWWGRALVPAIPLIIFLILVHNARSRTWPRPFRQVDDLTRQLPPSG